MDGGAIKLYGSPDAQPTMRPSMQVDIVELKSATNFGYLMAIFFMDLCTDKSCIGIIADRLNKKWLIVGSLFVCSPW